MLKLTSFERGGGGGREAPAASSFAHANPDILQECEEHFVYDDVFACHEGQDAVTRRLLLGSGLLKDFFGGRNCCVVTYGQTGTGKTYTMYGETTNGKVEMAVPGEIRRPEIAAKARADAKAREGHVKAAAGSVGAGQEIKAERDAKAAAAAKLGGRRGSIVALRMGLLPRLAEGIFQFFQMPGVDAASISDAGTLLIWV